MPDDDAHALLDRFRVLDVTPDEWTHDAHVAVCWAALRRHSSDTVLALLRQAIRRHNEAHGTPNTPSTGYHETITRYYVAAVAALGHVPVATALSSSQCRHDAPLAHWHRETLFGSAARADWVEPDRAPLPWPTSTAPATRGTHSPSGDATHPATTETMVSASRARPRPRRA